MPGYDTTSGPAGIADSLDKFDQIFQNGKIADAMVKANPDLLAGMGFQSPAQFQAMSAQQKIASTTGFFKAQGAKEAMAKISDMDAQAEYRRQQAADDQTAGAFLQNYLTAPATKADPTDGKDVPTTPQERLAVAAQKTQGMSGRILPKVMESLAKWQTVTANAEEDNTPEWTKGPNGEDVMIQPKTKNSPMISPFSKAAARLEEIKAQGEVTAGKGLLPPGTTFRTTENGYGIAELPDGSMKSLGRVPATKAAKHSFFESLMEGGAKPAAAAAAEPEKAAAPLALPMKAGKMDASQMKAGQVYQTKHGAATWDGKQFQLVQ